MSGSERPDPCAELLDRIHRAPARDAYEAQMKSELEGFARKVIEKHEKAQAALVAVWIYCHQAGEQTNNADLIAVATSIKDKAPELFREHNAPDLSSDDGA